MTQPPNTGKHIIYKDQGGLPTIGYGHLLSDLEKDKYKDGITEKLALSLFAIDISERERAVKKHVTAELTQNQFDALVLLAFNIKPKKFPSSTVLKLINSKADISEIEKWWKAWNKVKIDGKYVVSKGLQIRRADEWNLYLTPEKK